MSPSSGGASRAPSVVLPVLMPSQVRLQFHTPHLRRRLSRLQWRNGSHWRRHPCRARCRAKRPSRARDARPAWTRALEAKRSAPQPRNNSRSKHARTRSQKRTTTLSPPRHGQRSLRPRLHLRTLSAPPTPTQTCSPSSILWLRLLPCSNVPQLLSLSRNPLERRPLRILSPLPSTHSSASAMAAGQLWIRLIRSLRR